MRQIAVNWSGQRGLATTVDGRRVIWFTGLRDWELMLETLLGQDLSASEKDLCPSDHPLLTIFTESTFESYDWLRREQVLALAAANRVIIKVIKPSTLKDWKLRYFPTMTPEDQADVFFNVRALNADENKRKEALDVRILWRVATETNVHFKTAMVRPRMFDTPRLQFEVARRHGNLTTSPFGRSLVARLPDPKTLGDVFKAMFCKNKVKVKYDLEKVGPFFLAYLESNKTREDFQRCCGFYGNGYPSYARATWARIVYGTRGRRGKAAKAKKILPSVIPPGDAQRELRHLYHLFRAGESMLGQDLSASEKDLQPSDPHAVKL
jgi:hypothetical protein